MGVLLGVPILNHLMPPLKAQSRVGVGGTHRLKSPFLQTLPVGSVVLSVLAEDKDTGPAGIVQYFILKVSVKSSCGPRWELDSLCLTSTRGQHLHRQPQP